MRVRRSTVLAGVSVLVLAVGPTVALAQEAGDGGTPADEPLAGYVGMASGAAFSARPVAPGLLPTGDAPFEVTVGLTSANVKSGGNAYGQSAALWPGSAAANLGPLLGTAAGQPLFSQAIPPWPVAVEATQDDGDVVKGTDPGPVLRASGKAGESVAKAQAGGGGIPGVLTFEAVSSVSRSAIDGPKLVTQSEVVMKGVSLADGVVTMDAVRSLSTATSDGTTSTSDGDVAVVGLEVGGVKAKVTSAGVEAGDTPFPGKAMTDALRKVLASAHITMTLTDGTGAAEGGTADRMSTGVLVSMANPAAAASPQLTDSKIELTLVPTAVGAMASPPFTDELGDVAGVDLAAPVASAPGDGGADGTGGSGFDAVADAVDATFPTGSAAGSGGTVGGSAGSGGSGGSSEQAFDGEPARKTFGGGGGVPVGMVVALLAGTVVGGRWIRRFVDRIVSSEG